MIENCEKRIHEMQRECTQCIEAAARKAAHGSAPMLL